MWGVRVFEFDDASRGIETQKLKTVIKVPITKCNFISNIFYVFADL